MTVRLLPPNRRDWGRAMRAELDRIDDDQERRAFARSCGRAALRQLLVPRTVGYLLLVAAVTAAGLYLAAGIGYPEVRIEMTVLVVLFAVLSLAGGGRGVFGPVGPSVAARLVRAIGFVALAGTLLWWIADPRAHRGNHTGEIVTMILVGVVLTGYLATLFAITAQASPLGSRALAVGSAFGSVGALTWWSVTLTQPYFGESLRVPVLVAAFCGVVAAPFTSTAFERSRQALYAAVLAPAVTLFLIPLLAGLTMQVSPRRVPHIVDSVMIAGSTAAEKLAENRIEIGDTYFGVLVFGAITFAVLGFLVGAARAVLSRWRLLGMTSAVIVVAALSSQWPVNIFLGAGGLGLATVTLILSLAGRPRAGLAVEDAG